MACLGLISLSRKLSRKLFNSKIAGKGKISRMNSINQSRMSLKGAGFMVLYSIRFFQAKQVKMFLKSIP